MKRGRDGISKNQNFVQSEHISIQIGDQNSQNNNENAPHKALKSQTPIQPGQSQGSA